MTVGVGGEDGSLDAGEFLDRLANPTIRPLYGPAGIFPAHI
jgi:hypothetical protein